MGKSRAETKGPTPGTSVLQSRGADIMARWQHVCGQPEKPSEIPIQTAEYTKTIAPLHMIKGRETGLLMSVKKM